MFVFDKPLSNFIYERLHIELAIAYCAVSNMTLFGIDRWYTFLLSNKALCFQVAYHTQQCATCYCHALPPQKALRIYEVILHFINNTYFWIYWITSIIILVNAFHWQLLDENIQYARQYVQIASRALTLYSFGLMREYLELFHYDRMPWVITCKYRHCISTKEQFIMTYMVASVGDALRHYACRIYHFGDLIDADIGSTCSRAY